VKWKGYHPTEASWVNEFDMEHAQEAIEEFHTSRQRKDVERDEDITFLLVGQSVIKCTTSSCK
jgi:hypothetical protein